MAVVIFKLIYWLYNNENFFIKCEIFTLLIEILLIIFENLTNILKCEFYSYLKIIMIINLYIMYETCCFIK